MADNKNMEINDEDMKKAAGGLGGTNEATCPKCGKPMKWQDNPYGDGIWHCDACNENQMLSDAETIEMIKAAEASGQTQGLVYPVWWDKVKH
jgi:ribosomal protein L37AE/L43A